MSNISQWDPVAGNNNNPPPDGAPEGMNYSIVNNWGRETMGAVARQYKDLGGGITSGGTGNNYTVATASQEPAYAVNQTVSFIADKTNTGAATIQRDTLGPLPVVYGAAEPLPAGAIRAGRVYTAYCDSTRFFITYNPSVDPSANNKPYAQDTGGSRNLIASDMETFTGFTSATAIILTIPDNATTPLPVGTEMEILQEGAGQITLAGAAGVTVNPPAGGTLVFAGQWSAVGIKKIATDTWVAMGRLTAV